MGQRSRQKAERRILREHAAAVAAQMKPAARTAYVKDLFDDGLLKPKHAMRMVEGGRQ